MHSKKIDMTTGPIMRNVFLFAIPIVIGNILQQLYTTVDTLVIGKYCGKTSLAAVGTSSQPVEVFLCIFLGIGSGVSILVSQSIGSKNIDRINRLCKTAVFFIYICGIPLSILGYLAAPFLLKMMGVPADAWDAALTYTRIIFLGTTGSLGYNMNAGILRGMGDSKASLWFLVASCVVNIVLDIVFVALLKMEVSGAALATIIAMFISWCISICYIKKKFPELHFPVFSRHFHAAELKSIIKIGLPIGLNNSLYSFGHMVTQTMVNAQGSTFMAGLSVAGRITGCSNMAISALSAAATTFSGQNYGAQNIERLRKGYIKIPVVSGMITIAFGLFFISIRMPILKFFSTDPEVLMYASRYVVVTLLAQWMFAVFNGISCFVNGVGLVKYTTVINLLMLWAVRIPSAYLIMRFFDGTFIMFCFPISFAFGMFCMIGYYLFSPKWKAIMNQENAAV
ncbi:MAG: MATE family efflux transporter [Bacillus sp. (in: Bacteria)]|nr:MATE family efflux transporter [Bacillus sp. (in: firmicutes)]MCM1425790.1 MATE family efflux transporter [Eubacterium sp.]